MANLNLMEGPNTNANIYTRQQSGISAVTDEPEHETTVMKKRGHIAQSRSAQKSHALPRSSSRPRSGQKSRSKSRTRSSSRGKMGTPTDSAVSDDANNKHPLKRSGSLNRFSSWNMIRDGKIDDHGRCIRHPNIELYRRDAKHSDEPWRMLLQDCPLCSLHDSAMGSNDQYHEMIHKDSITLSGEVTTQTNGTDATSPSSGEDTSLGSDASNSNVSIRKRQKIRPPSTSKQVPPPPPPPQLPKQSSVQTLKALGRMHIDGDDAISTASRRSRHPPPPPPAGRKPVSNSTPINTAKKGSNASITSLSTKELSKLRRDRHLSRGHSDSMSELGRKHNSEKDLSLHHDLGRSLERLRAERKAAGDTLKERRELGRSRSQKERSEEAIGMFTVPLNDVGRGRAIAAHDDDILGAAAEIRARARRSLSRSKERKKAAEDMFGSPSISGDDLPADGDAVSVASRGRRSIANPHGLAEQPRPLPVERRSKSRERRSHSDDRSVDRGGVLERQWYVPTNERCERSSEALINRRREMRQQLVERQNKADVRRRNSGDSLSLAGDVDDLIGKDEVVRETRRSARSKERGDRGRGRSRSRVRDGLSKIRSASLALSAERSERGRGRSRSLVRDGISKIRSASLNAFRRLDSKKLDIDDQTTSFRTIVSQGSRRLRSLSRESRDKASNRLRSLSRERHKPEREDMHNSVDVNDSHASLSWWANEFEA